MSNMQNIDTQVLRVFHEIAPEHRQILLDVRELIFEVAASDPRIDAIEETLRWGEPAYVTTKNKTGSTIRLGIEKNSGTPALFFNCKTTLVEGFRQKFGVKLSYSKNRAILLNGDLVKIGPALTHCIAAALTYHLRA